MSQRPMAVTSSSPNAYRTMHRSKSNTGSTHVRVLNALTSCRAAASTTSISEHNAVQDSMDNETSVSPESSRVSFIIAVSTPMDAGSSRSAPNRTKSRVCSNRGLSINNSSVILMQSISLSLRVRIVGFMCDLPSECVILKVYRDVVRRLGRRS